MQNNPVQNSSKNNDNLDLSGSVSVKDNTTIDKINNFELNTSNITANTSPPPSHSINFQSITNSPHTPQKYGGKKVIATILGLIIMLGSIGTIAFLVQNQQLKVGSAWDCSKYNFHVSRTGVVTVQNGSRYNESVQDAQVYINNTLVSTFSVPALTSGQGATLGTVSVPSRQGFTWKVHGTIDCEDEGSYHAETTPSITISASCNNVIAYDKNWQQLNNQQLSQLKAGDIVRFTIGGTTTSGSFDKARFIINGVQKPETTSLRPNTSEFYYEYIIPSETTTFEVKAEIHHSQLGWL
ncbi:MAG: hypothetical protein N2558_03255 [Patescibacteria group bacterium]|nr:hypothetical protein [Patescibacteria group bacterium]